MHKPLSLCVWEKESSLTQNVLELASLPSPPPSKPRKSPTLAHRGQHCPCSRCWLVPGNSVHFVSGTEPPHPPCRGRGRAAARAGRVCRDHRELSWDLCFPPQGGRGTPSLQRHLGNTSSLRQRHMAPPRGSAEGAGALSPCWEEPPGLRSRLCHFELGGPWPGGNYLDTLRLSLYNGHVPVKLARAKCLAWCTASTMFLLLLLLSLTECGGGGQAGAGPGGAVS